MPAAVRITSIENLLRGLTFPLSPASLYFDILISWFFDFLELILRTSVYDRRISLCIPFCRRINLCQIELLTCPLNFWQWYLDLLDCTCSGHSYCTTFVRSRSPFQIIYHSLGDIGIWLSFRVTILVENLISLNPHSFQFVTILIIWLLNKSEMSDIMTLWRRAANVIAFLCDRAPPFSGPSSLIDRFRTDWLPASQTLHRIWDLRC